MKTFVTFAEARRIDFKQTEKIASQPSAWKARVTLPDGSVLTLPPGCDLKLEGFSGFAQLVVALDGKGEPIYDKLLYSQKSGVAIVAWGRDAGGTTKLAYLEQARPFADDPEHPEPGLLVFGQIPMGFLTAADRELPLKEGVERAVHRELREEAGIREVIEIEIPEPATCWQDPTLIRNGTLVAFAQVVLPVSDDPSGLTAGDGEDIRKIEFLSVKEIRRRIAAGKTADGVIHHMGISLAPLMMFFARHPELFGF
ncbi:MAG: NUDIX hydrolase [bacterium]|nr:NUDIX hydrolase [bacterium]